jgi:hypothetical protein
MISIHFWNAEDFLQFLDMLILFSMKFIQFLLKLIHAFNRRGCICSLRVIQQPNIRIINDIRTFAVA